ncbi:MAG: peptidylprolyl isomerase, partial [Methylacidiphilales bacterium]|nr:peptidylprolyl isomerase [Candidatus Methylacidiphilales bacterium]
MLSFLNQKLKFLLIVILGVIGISFVFFGNWTPRNGGGSVNDSLAVIDGHTIRYADLANAERATRLIYMLQTGRPAPSSAQADQAFRQRTWSRLLILAAARKAGINTSDAQVYDFILQHPFFQEKGQYSDERRNNFRINFLSPQGINDARFTEIIRDELSIERMVKAVSDTTVVLPAEIEETCEKLYGKASLEYVEISESEIRKSLKPSAQEIKTFYDANPATYLDPEKRVVEYVKFPLDPKQSQLKGAERDEALRKLGQKAYEFANIFFQAYDTKQPVPDFSAEVRKQALEVKATAAFTRNESIIDSTKGKA